MRYKNTEHLINSSFYTISSFMSNICGRNHIGHSNYSVQNWNRIYLARIGKFVMVLRAHCAKLRKFMAKRLVIRLTWMKIRYVKAPTNTFLISARMCSKLKVPVFVFRCKINLLLLCYCASRLIYKTLVNQWEQFADVFFLQSFETLTSDCWAIIYYLSTGI